MRNRVRGAVAVLLFAVVFIAPIAIAELPPEAEPPQARIRPPGGVQSTADEPLSVGQLVWIWLQARIRPPVGLY